MTPVELHLRIDPPLTEERPRWLGFIEEPWEEEGPRLSIPPPLFETIQGQGTLAVSFAISSLGHVAFLFAVVPLVSLLLSLYAEPVAYHVSAVEPLRIVLPPRLVTPATAKPAAAPGESGAVEHPLAADADSKRILLQPDVARRVRPPQLSLPPIVLWASAARSRVRGWVPAGHMENPLDQLPPAPPSLERPNQEPAGPGPSVAASEPQENPKLPVTPNSSVPVRLESAGGAGMVSVSSLAQAGLDTPPVVSLSREPGPNTRLLELPPWVEAGGVAGAVPAGETNAIPTPSGGAASAAASPATAARGSANGNGGANNASPSAASARSRENAKVGAVAPAATTAVTETAAPPPSALAALKATGLLSDGSFRRVHQAGGNPDVVVVQNSVDAILPELTGVLSGRPVYSIYLLVGDRNEREWLLQYCLPGSAGGAEPQGMVVTLAAPTPLTAPYPRVTLRPPPGVLARDRRTVIAGSITTEGRFLALRGVAPAGPLAGGILEALRQWEFRPALRDGVPALVEILLLIPPGI